jgi:hypothetical protein
MLVTKEGYYEQRGAMVWAIAKLMQVNDLVFEAQKQIGPASGIRIDYKPLFAEISRMIEQLRVEMDRE